MKLYGNLTIEETARPLLRILDSGGPNEYKDTGSGEWIDGFSGENIDKTLGDISGDSRNWYAELAITIRKLIEAEQNTAGTRNDKLKAVSNRFYRGDIADDLVEWYIERGGFLRKEDLAEHVTRVEDPVAITYRGHTVFKCDTWTQVPYLNQTLRLLEGYNLKKMGFLSPDYIHVVTESMKLALADRDEFYGDPLFADVPLEELLSDEYTELRRKLINMKTASQELRPGDPCNMKALLEGGGKVFPNEGGTTTCVAADKWGNVVVTTPSGLGSSAGSGGRTGVTHGSRLVMKYGKPFLAISVAGGDMQDQAALQLILDVIDFDMDLDSAMNAIRFSTQHFIGSFGQDPPKLGNLSLHEKIDKKTQDDLKNRGHKVEIVPYNIGGVAMLYINARTGLVYGSGSASVSVK